MHPLFSFVRNAVARIHVVLPLVAFLICCLHCQLLSAQTADFQADIQPILAEHCYACHGPDAKTRQADLRLDIEDQAKESAIQSGDADESELIARIESDDESDIMPPPDFNKPLTAEQKALLRRWIDEGAKWEQHWAFQPIGKPTPPDNADSWSRNEIDQFIKLRMQENQLAPNPPADRNTLFRRIYLDLIGKNPTPEQLATFESDTCEHAMERVIDELLASPHYGEHMAVKWLDAARFADTNGYQNDFVRSMWPYRDWVIDAFNQNLPYDQFIRDQIAGDMLTTPSQSQLIASGFNRNNHSVTEGGSIDEEWRIENGVDRVETTSTAFLGLTMGCARCHDHKYDPINQNEFYKFFAFFNNVDEKGVYIETRGNAGPTLRLPTPAQNAKLAELAEQIAALDKHIAEMTAATNVDNVIASARERLSKSALPKPIYSFQFPQSETGSPVSPTGFAKSLDGSPDANPNLSQIDFDFAFDRNQPFAWTAWVHGDARGAIFAKMDESQDHRGVDGIILDDGKLKIHLIHQWNQNAIAVITRGKMVPGEWNHVGVSYDGSSKANGITVFVNGQKMEFDVEVDSLSESIENQVDARLGQRNTSVYFKGQMSGFYFFDRALAGR
ncbi:MAG: DUF1549 domain-containing protein [Pirellulaceae bacterium]